MTAASGTDEHRSSRSVWFSRLTSPPAAWLILGAFYVFLVVGTNEKSATMDEFRHASAGYSYWKFNDYRLDPENGNWSKRWTALPLLAGTNPFPNLDSDLWQYGSNSELADAWFNRAGNNSAAMLRRGRAASGLMAVALGVIVWAWSRRLFGPAGGILSLLLYVFSPIVLANGALMTSDMPAACFFLASLWFFEAMLRRLSPGTVLASAAATAGLLLAKMSGPIVIPVLFALATIRLLSRKPIQSFGGKLLATVRAKFLGLALAALVQVVVIWGLIWASYGFRYSAFATPPQQKGSFTKPWEWALGLPEPIVMLDRLGLSDTQARQIASFLLAHGIIDLSWSNAVVSAIAEVTQAGLLSPAQSEALERLRATHPERFSLRLISVLRRHQLLPEAYLYGYANVLKMSDFRGGFLNGRVSMTGFRAFFPYVFAVKTPLAIMALVCLAFAAFMLGPRAFRNRGSPGGDANSLTLNVTFSLWALLIVYAVVAITSPVNIGHRHLLPIYPALYVLCGAVVFWARWRPIGAKRLHFPPWLSGSWPVGALATIAALETVGWYPNYIAYFNGLIDPSRAYRHLVDSSLDWGQDLPAAKRYIESHKHGNPFFLIYFGSDSPQRHGIRVRQVYGYPNVEGDQDPLFKILRDISPAQKAAGLSKFFLENPDYDSSFLARLDATPPTPVALKRASALRLEAGTYLISASLVQPLFYHRANQPWSSEQEAVYQSLRQEMLPILQDDGPGRAAAFAEQKLFVWKELFSKFQEFRFARLASYLRRREPDDTINYSILVYRLSQADIELAENGPAPIEGG